MKGIRFLFGGLFKFLGKIKGVIPKFVGGIFLFISFIFNLFTIGPKEATLNLAREFFSAEVTIHEIVDLAIANDPSYRFIQFLTLIASVMIIVVWVQWMYWLITKSMNLNDGFSQYFWALLITGLIEMAAIALLDKQFIIPIWHGLGYLLFNIAPVFYNIHIFGWQVVSRKISDSIGINASAINLTRP